MEWLQSFMSRFAEAFRWLWILQPWEQALRVRGGKKIVKFHGGLHFKIPYLDYIFSQNCRMRLSEVPSQTVTTLDGKSITLSGALAYRVDDVEPLYTKLHMAEETLSRKTQGIISSYIAWHHFSDCSPKHVMEYVDEHLQLGGYGLADVEFILKDFAVVKTYRFITGDVESYMSNSLQTDEADEV